MHDNIFFGTMYFIAENTVIKFEQNDSWIEIVATIIYREKNCKDTGTKINVSLNLKIQTK